MAFCGLHFVWRRDGGVCGFIFYKMRLSFAGIRNSLPFSGLIRQLEQEMETVVKVLHPGPLGIIEHKFSSEEIREANDTVQRAVANWRRNAIIEERNHVIKDYFQK